MMSWYCETCGETFEEEYAITAGERVLCPWCGNEMRSAEDENK
jgi:formylmethanofuran dehydrogenase subunit E